MKKIEIIIIDSLKHLVLFVFATFVLCFIIAYTGQLLECARLWNLQPLNTPLFEGNPLQSLIIFSPIGIGATLVKMMQKYNSIGY